MQMTHSVMRVSHGFQAMRSAQLGRPDSTPYMLPLVCNPSRDNCAAHVWLRSLLNAMQFGGISL